MISLTTRKIFMMNCRITSLKIYKKFFKEIILESFSGKDAKNSSDYRASLLIVCGWLMKKQPDHFVSKILLPHTEIQEILYQTDKDRRTTSILGLHSFCFQHAMLFKINLQGKLMTLTSRKFFGFYYHSLIKHAPEKCSLFSGRSSDTEKGEGTFKSIKMFNNLSSNHDPNNNDLINALIRLQCRETLQKTQLRQESRLTNLYSEIKKCSQRLHYFHSDG